MGGLLLGTADEVGLPDNGPTGYFDATIGEAGVEEGALFDAYLGIVQNAVDGTDAAEIIVFLLENEVNVDLPWSYCCYLEVYIAKIFQIINI